MSKPLIGITTYVEPSSWGHWEDVEAALVPYSYVRAVERAGGRAVLVPPDENGIDEVLEALDGLVFSGGNDLEPDGYGAEAHRSFALIVKRVHQEPNDHDSLHRDIFEQYQQRHFMRPWDDGLPVVRESKDGPFEIPDATFNPLKPDGGGAAGEAPQQQARTLP